MSTRDRMNSASIAPGAILKTEYFNIGSANSIEYNVDQEFMLMAEHLAVDFVVTIPTFNDGDFEGGYVAGDALEVSRNAGDTSNIDIKPGAGWIGGRRYKQVNTISDYDLSGTTPDTLHYIRLKYTFSTAQFAFIAETSESADSSTVKYLSLASATWNTGGTYWDNDFTDMRATNTSLPTPVSFIGSEAANYILTVRNTNASKLSADIDGYLRVGTPSTDGQINLYAADAAEGLTIYNNSGSYSALISTNNTDQIFIDDKLEVDTSIKVGGTTIQDAAISGITSFTFGASPSISTASGDFNWNSENFGSVGTIGSGAITSSGIVEGTQLKSTIAIGTRPLIITSTTVCDNLNAEKVAGYGFTGVSGDVTADAAELSLIDGYTGDSTDLNTIKRSGKSQGEIMWANSAGNITWLSSASGVLTNASDVITWDTTPAFTGVTVAGATGVTWDNATTDVTITSVDGVLNFGDAVTLRDKSAGEWSITGAGAATFDTLGVSGLTVDTSGIVTAGTWQGTAITNTYLASFGTNAQLDQNANQAASPIFVGLTLSGTVSGGTWQGNAITNTYLASFGTSAQLDQDARTTASPSFDEIRTSSVGDYTTSRTSFGGAGTSCYIRMGTDSLYVLFYEASNRMRISTNSSLGIEIDNDLKVTGTTTLTGTGHVYPESDSTYTCGINTKRWSILYTDDIVTGDIILDNGMVINEVTDDDGNVLTKPKDGRIPGIQFNSTSGQTIMMIDDNGLLHLPSGTSIIYDL